jgi:hypothetical protein
MRHFCVFLTALVMASLAVMPDAFAISSSATPGRVKCATTNITTSAWVPVITSTTKAVKGLLIYSTANVAAAYGDLAIGIAASSASAGTEVAQAYIQSAAGGNPIYVPITMSGSVRISVEALDATQVLGEIVIDPLYN